MKKNLLISGFLISIIMFYSCFGPIDKNEPKSGFSKLKFYRMVGSNKVLVSSVDLYPKGITAPRSLHSFLGRNYIGEQIDAGTLTDYYNTFEYYLGYFKEQLIIDKNGDTLRNVYSFDGIGLLHEKKFYKKGLIPDETERLYYNEKNKLIKFIRLGATGDTLLNIDYNYKFSGYVSDYLITEASKIQNKVVISHNDDGYMVKAMSYTLINNNATDSILYEFEYDEYGYVKLMNAICFADFRTYNYSYTAHNQLLDYQFKNESTHEEAYTLYTYNKYYYLEKVSNYKTKDDPNSFIDEIFIEQE